MKILLQDRNTLEFVDQYGFLTANHNSARQFSTGYDALLFCLHNRLRNVQVLCEFSDARLNYTVPVVDACLKRLLKEEKIKQPATTISGLIYEEAARSEPPLLD